MSPSLLDVHIASPSSEPSSEDALCFDRLLGNLAVPLEGRKTLWLRLEPLGRLDILMQDRFRARTYGLFVTWRPKSVQRHLVDTMVLVDEATCHALRRVCVARGIHLVDNSCLAIKIALARAG